MHGITTVYYDSSESEEEAIELGCFILYIVNVIQKKVKIVPHIRIYVRIMDEHVFSINIRLVLCHILTNTIRKWSLYLEDDY